MKRKFRLRDCPIAKVHHRSRGYILITLMLFLSLLAIAALAVLPDVAFQIKRDREEEMIHRALGYSRGIRRFYKKFGRYPTSVEELENTNNLRFIRKRYQDPVTGKDFKILRMGDPQLGSMMLGQVAGQGLLGQLGGQTAQGGGAQQRGALATNLLQAASQQTQVTTTDPTNAAGGPAGDSANPPEGPANANSAVSSSSSSSTDTSSSKQQVFGGGPMLGVVSISKAITIREFNHKNHYKDWLFIYDPTSDRGGMLNAPVQPGLNGGGFGGSPLQPAGGQTPPNAGAPPGGTPPTQTPTNPNLPNPGGAMPPEQ